MSLSDIVSVTIDKQTATVSRTGFGVPMILSAEAEEDERFAGDSKIYTALDQLGSTGDDFDTDGVTYLKAAKLFSQNPKPRQIVIGKRNTLPTPTINMIPIAVGETAYEITITGRGVADTFTYTSDDTPTIAEIITGMVALINAGTQDVLATNNGPGTSMDVETAASPGGASAPGKPFTIEYDRSLWTVQNITADPGLATDIDTVRNSLTGNDDWYCLLLDSSGEAEILAAAAKIETLFKIFLGVTSDADVLTSSTNDVISQLQALNYDRTAVMWHEDPHEGAEAAWGGQLLPQDPGSETWAYKTLTGIAASNLTPSEIAFLEGKNGNHYQEIASVSVTRDGRMVSGEWIDVTRGLDFVVARIRENVFSRLVNLPKIPMTNRGISVVESEVRGVLRLGVSQGIFTDDPAPTVTVPDVSDIDANDRANRILPDVEFTAQLAGAIHTVVVQGVVTV
jgi:hypothetical protein